MADKIQTLRNEVERLMHGFNLEADIASCEDAEAEKIADIKYQLCKKILERIDEVQKEPVSKELEEEITDYINKHYHIRNDETLEVGNDPINTYDFADAARHFANWQKEQIMANAVDGAYIRRNRYTKKNVLNGLDITCEAIQSFKDKDKIKVLFIKED